MGLTLQVPPGFSDLANAALVADSPAFAINLAKIYSNAAFGMVRTEVFHDILAHGQTVPLHSSPSDGYNYSRAEQLYIWHVHSSGDPNGNWISGADSLWYCNWKVDQATGAVTSHEWYRRSGAHYDGAHTNDGSIRVITIAQRMNTTLIMAGAAAYSAISAGLIGIDKPLTQALAQALNDDAKFGVVNSEVIYLGEYSHGDTVPHPVSPADAYSYAYSECQFMFSWRWTSGTTTFAAPLLSKGQLGPFLASVSSVGVVSTTVKYIDNNGSLNSFNEGRIAVFAFCTRSATPSSISPAAASFTELNYDLFMPGETLRASTVQSIIDDILESVVTPEFFGPTTYQDGDTIPLPVSAVDGYTYSRSEIDYIPTWSNTTNEVGSNLRLPMFYGLIGQNNGNVRLQPYRLAPGGDYVLGSTAYARISVIVMARRQAQLPTTPATVTITPGSGVIGTGSAGSGADVPTLSGIQSDVFTGDGTTTGFTLTAAPAGSFAMVFWGPGIQLPADYSISGTTLTTAFKDAGGNSIAAQTGDKIYVVYFT